MAVSRLPGVRRQFLHAEDGSLANEIQILNLTGISVSAKGCQQSTRTFPNPFLHACDGIWLQIKEFRQNFQGTLINIDCPSGLKVMVWPPKRLQTKTGFQLNVDVNVSCILSGVVMDVDALILGH